MCSDVIFPSASWLPAPAFGEDDVEGSSLCLHSRVESVEVCQIGHRARHRAGTGSEIGHSGVERFLSTAEDENEGAFIDKALCCGAADALSWLLSMRGASQPLRGDSIECSPQSAVGSEVWGQIGVMLFDRSGRLPEAHTRRRHPVGGRSHGCLGSGYAEGSRQAVSAGLEAELSVVIDVFFPTAVFSAAAKAFASQFPLTPRVRGRARSIRTNEHRGCTDRNAKRHSSPQSASVLKKINR